ncbi:MAG: A24 family peptidase [Nanoarchaeota archaeon]
MLTDILLVSLGVFGLIIATITDLKWREVPDYLNYFLITAGFGLRFFHSALFDNWIYFLYGVLGFLAAFGIGIVFYFFRQWGGGDTKLLMSLGVIFGSRPFFIQDEGVFFLNLIFSIFVTGAVYGLVYGIYLALRNFSKFKEEFNLVMKGEKIRIVKNISFLVALVSFILAYLSKDLATKIILISLSLFLIIYIYFWIFVKAVENVCMYKIVNVNELSDGDWVVDDVYANKKLIYDKNKLGVEKKDILKFMKEGVKKVRVKYGIPFVPSFLIGTVLTLIFGNLLI